MFHVYRVALRDAIRTCAKFVARNPHVVAEQSACFYVGSTGLDVNDRIQAHINGTGRGGHHIVRDYASTGMRGRVNVVTVRDFATRAEAEAFEKEHAASLVAQGYGIWVNHKARR